MRDTPNGPVAHKFVPVASQTVKSEFKPGTVARSVFEEVNVNVDRASFDMNRICVVFDKQNEEAVVFRGSTRYDKNGKLFSAVKTMLNVKGLKNVRDVRALKFGRQHGEIVLI